MFPTILDGLITVVGGGLVASLGFLFGRKKLNSEVRNTDADTEAKEADLAFRLATGAIERMDRAERKIDEMEREWSQLRQEIYPHRAWDDRAYRTALLVDPDFDPPPSLSI